MSFAKDIKITAQSWIVTDRNGTVIESQNSHEIRAIGSITKLMTAMVVVDAGQDLTAKVNRYTRQELLQLALVKSDNQAADDLCNSYPGGRADCIVAMNKKAQSLGLINTHYVEPTGLSVFNTSTAEELVKLIIAASKYEIIREAAVTPQVKIKLKKRWFVFNNTNPIIGHNHNFIVSKTGYIRASGGCIAVMVETEIGIRIAVVLGSKNTHTRIPEVEFIINNY
jgi:D-alanyl-D-alanine endopeptidase (penicillin-binding protein 7)